MEDLRNSMHVRIDDEMDYNLERTSMTLTTPTMFISKGKVVRKIIRLFYQRDPEFKALRGKRVKNEAQ